MGKLHSIISYFYYILPSRKSYVVYSPSFVVRGLNSVDCHLHLASFRYSSHFMMKYFKLIISDFLYIFIKRSD